MPLVYNQNQGGQAGQLVFDQGPIASKPRRPSLEQVQAREAEGHALTEEELRVLYEQPWTVGKMAKAGVGAVGQVASYVGKGVWEAAKNLHPLNPTAAPQALSTLYEGAVRGTYDLDAIIRQGFAKGADYLAVKKLNDMAEFFEKQGNTEMASKYRERAKETDFDLWKERRRKNMATWAVRSDPNELLAPGVEHLPESMQPLTDVAELSSYVLDPTVPLSLGTSAAVKAPAKAAARTLVKAGVKAVEKSGAAIKAAGRLPTTLAEKMAEQVGGPQLAKEIGGASKVLHTVAIPAAFAGVPVAPWMAAARGAELGGAAMQRTGQFARHVMDADGMQQFSRFAQVARDPTSPGWMRFMAALADKANVEGIGRAGAAVSAGAGKGAVVGTLMGAAAAESPEELGAAIGTGAAIGGFAGMGEYPIRAHREKLIRKQNTISKFVAKQLTMGATPETFKKVDGGTILQAATIDHVFEGMLDIRFMETAEFQKLSSDPGAAAAFDPKTRQLMINVDASRGSQANLGHEIGHALATSEVASRPEIRQAIDAVIGERIDMAKDIYAASLAQARQGQAQRGAGPPSIPITEWLKNPENRVLAEAEKARQTENSLDNYGDPDFWIYTEIFAEASMNVLKDTDIADKILSSPGVARRALLVGQRTLESMGVKFDTKADKGGTPTFFANLEDVIADKSLNNLVKDYLRQRNKFLSGKHMPRDDKVVVTEDMVGRHPGVPVHTRPDNTRGSDFYTIDPKGRIVPHSKATVRKIEQARAAEVEAAIANLQPGGPGMEGMVRPRRTISGLYQLTGQQLGPWFTRLRSFGPEAKATAAMVEQTIAQGGTIRFWYQAVSSGRGAWRRNLPKLAGGLAVSDREAVPFTFIVTKPGTVDAGGRQYKKGGNILVVAFDIGAMYKRLSQWQHRRGDLSMDLWNGSIADFMKDLKIYMQNHAEGRPGADNGVGEQKRNVLNAFILGDNRAHSTKNPLRDVLRGKEREGMVRSFRLDRMEAAQPGSQAFPKGDYNSKVLNLSPDMNDPLQATQLRVDEVQADLHPDASKLLLRVPGYDPRMADDFVALPDVDKAAWIQDSQWRVKAGLYPEPPPILTMSDMRAMQEASNRPNKIGITPHQTAQARRYARRRGDGSFAFSPDLWVVPEGQRITSADTDIKQVPATLRLVPWKRGTVNADIGGGASDKFTKRLRSKGVENVVYDPFQRSAEHNVASALRIKDGQADTVTVNNVLNVIENVTHRERVIAQAADAVKDKTNGKVYFKIYSGDGTGKPKATRAGWQNNKSAEAYVKEIERYFGSVKRKGDLLIANDVRKGLQQASPDFVSQPERIAAAAIEIDGKRYTGASHMQAIFQAVQEGIDFDALSRGEVAVVDGFMTDKGRFVSREEGMEIATKAEQMAERAGSTLTSEDITDPGQGGRGYAPAKAKPTPEGSATIPVRPTASQAAPGSVGAPIEGRSISERAKALQGGATAAEAATGVNPEPAKVGSVSRQSYLVTDETSTPADIRRMEQGEPVKTSQAAPDVAGAVPEPPYTRTPRNTAAAATGGRVATPTKGTTARLARDARRGGAPVAQDGGLNIATIARTLQASPDHIPNVREWANKHLLGNPAVKALYSEADLNQFVRGLESAEKTFRDFGVWPDAELDEGKAVSPIRGNSDPLFEKTFDLSTICPKQDQYVSIINTLEREQGRIFTPQERFMIGEIMGDAGVTTCWFCYGQSARNRYDFTMQKAVEVFTALNKPGRTAKHAKTVFTEKGGPGWSVMSARNKKKPGVLWGAIKNLGPEVRASKYKIDPVRMRDLARGYAAPESKLEIALAKELHSFVQAAAKANAPKGYAPYTKQLLHPSQKKWIAKFNKSAGYRMNSQTDFRVWHTLDLARFLSHLGAQDGMAHVYFRAPDMINIFGDTNIKFNMSTEVTTPLNVPNDVRHGRIASQAEFDALHREFGEPDWNDMNGMPHDAAMQYRDQHPKDAGTMLVAVDEYQLWWALGSDKIDMIIPYHRGAVEKPIEAYHGSKDFSSEQHEHWPKDWKAGKTRTATMPDGEKVSLTMPKKDSKKPVITREHHKGRKDYYLAMAEQMGFEPRFSRFVDHPGYMKMIRDVAREPMDQRPVDVTKINWEAFNEAVERWRTSGDYLNETEPNPGLLRYVRERVKNNEWPESPLVQAGTVGVEGMPKPQ
jgi:hypothetical protein